MTAGAASGGCEVSWFSALCDDDYEQLGVPAPHLMSSWQHCRDIVTTAEASGFDNVLLPSGYALGIDAVAFAGGIAALTERIRVLVAVRCGELHVAQLARQLATLDEMLGGRLTVNIISSDLPGETLASGPRYQRTLETMQALRTLLGGERLDLQGRYVDLHLDPPRASTVARRCPPLYFGGLSEEAREVAAQQADVYLMWARHRGRCGRPHRRYARPCNPVRPHTSVRFPGACGGARHRGRSTRRGGVPGERARR